MCNACGYQCCASDEFESCGCEDCDEPDCWPPLCPDCGEFMYDDFCSACVDRSHDGYC